MFGAQIILQWRTAIDAGAYSRLSAYANGRMNRDDAVHHLIDIYGRMGTFGTQAAEMVVASFDAGRIKSSGSEQDANDEPIMPRPGAIDPTIASAYQYDISLEFECRGETGYIFQRIDSDVPLSIGELYGKTLNLVFSKAAEGESDVKGINSACEPTGNYILHAAFAQNL